MFLTATTSGRYTRSGISLRGSFVKVTTWLWIGCTIASTLVTSQQNFYTNGRYGKRQDPGQASPFWSGSRYGRSGDSAVIGGPANGVEDKIDAGASKDVELSPRMDRFFLGSRYGKRKFSNDERDMDSLKQHFETSLDFLISVDHLQSSDKEQLRILNEELKDNENLIAIKYGDNNNSTSSDFIKSYGTFAENGFACLYTGVTNLYRCFHRKNYETTQDSSN